VSAALFWSVLFFGLIDLATIVVPGEFLPTVPLEASWGAFFTMIVAGAFVRVAWRPGDRVVPAAQLLLAAVALTVGAALGGRPEPIVVAAVLAVLAGLLLLRTSRPRRAELQPRGAVPLLVLAVAAVPFWAGYAWHAAAASRSGVDDDISVGIPHWAVQSAVGVAILACAVVAGVWPRGRGLLGTCAGVAAVLLGVATASYPEATGAMPSPLAGFAAVAWGLAVAVLAHVPRTDVAVLAPLPRTD
jgi:hypothetical protein